MAKSLAGKSTTAGKTVLGVGKFALGATFGVVIGISTPTPAHAPTMQAGRVDVELTPEDFAAGFYFDHTGQLSKNGLRLMSRNSHLNKALAMLMRK
ncbi:hypothetical protein HGG73_11475 [Rhodobacteraceae bacterium R_SAG3]|nr:hypothetical protein [Rhodobacteraceae bacterium R_SAG3]